MKKRQLSNKKLSSKKEKGAAKRGPLKWHLVGEDVTRGADKLARTADIAVASWAIVRDQALELRKRAQAWRVGTAPQITLDVGQQSLLRCVAFALAADALAQQAIDRVLDLPASRGD